MMLGELVPVEGRQTNLFSTIKTSNESNRLISVMDTMNLKISKASLRLAFECFKRPCKMKQENKSPSDTTK